MLRAFTLALGLLLGAGTSSFGQTPIDINSAAVAGPFNEADGHKTYITASAPGGFSFTTGLPQIVTHWTFWSDSCQHLADFEACLTLNDTIVVDVSDMGGIGIDNERLNTRFDLTGYRGTFTIHAFEADPRCREPADAGYRLVPEAINATWTIADIRAAAAFGDRAFGFDLDPTGTFVEVPQENFEAVDLSFFNPDSLSSSSVILLSIVENFGDFTGELGPPQGRIVVGAQARACDTQEACLSLPDVQIGCALFGSLIPGPGGLIPETLMPSSSGFYRLSTPRFVQNDVGLTNDEIWIYSFHGQQLGPFGTGARGIYTNILNVAPTPTPTASPTASLTPAPTPTLATATPAATPTPGGSPTATPVETPTPLPSPAGPTPTAGVATPTPVATLLVTPSPTPTPFLFSPSPFPSPSATPTP